MVPGSRPKIKFDFKNYLDYLIREVRLAEEKGRHYPADRCGGRHTVAERTEL